MKKAKPQDVFDNFLKAFSLNIKSQLDKKIKQTTDNIENCKKLKSDANKNPSLSHDDLIKYKEAQDKSIRRYEDQRISFKKKQRLMSDFDSKEIIKMLSEDKDLDELWIDQSNNSLNFITKMIKSSSRNIGKYRIVLYPTGESNGMPIFRVNNIYFGNTRGVYPHWAISGYTCCLGEWHLDFTEVLGRGDIVQFFKLVIHYLSLSPVQNTYFSNKEDWFDGSYVLEANEIETKKHYCLLKGVNIPIEDCVQIPL